MGKLSENPSPPKKRQRRWAIVALTILIVGLAWWIWPRADQRFVGKWRDAASGPAGYYVHEFKRDGSGSWVSISAAGQTGSSVPFQWRSINDTLIININSPLKDFAQYASFRLLGTADENTVHVMTVLEVDEKKLELRTTDGLGRASLIRLSN
jgi:hypothetical protein